MTDTTDALVGTVGGLLAVGILANTASRMMGNGNYPRQRRVVRKPAKKFHKAHTHWW